MIQRFTAVMLSFVAILLGACAVLDHPSPANDAAGEVVAPVATFAFEPAGGAANRAAAPTAATATPPAVTATSAEPSPVATATPTPTTTRPESATITPTATPAVALSLTATPVAIAQVVATATVPPVITPARTAEPVRAAASGGNAMVVGYGIGVRAEPNSKAAVVRRLSYLEEVKLLGTVKGERWVVGDQTWPMAYQAWTDMWYQVEGGFVYSAWIYIPGGESSPFVRGQKAIKVDTKNQTLTALVGGQVVYSANVTTGKDGFETPKGTFPVGSWGRVENETMTSAQAGIRNPEDEYNVRNVLFTQYFTSAGDALHLNYWQPDSVFGGYRTSHGCVGLLLHDAQWLWLFAATGASLQIQ